MLSIHRRRLRFEHLEDRRLLAVLTVNTTVDENNGIGVGGVSLREAVAAAAAGDTINFSVTGTINLTNAGTGEIQINKNLTIQGPGANQLTVRASDADLIKNSNGRRVFLVDNGNGLTLANVTISGLTLTNGDPMVIDENDGGGAIKNRENLTLNACVLSGNFSPNGGAIYSAAGTVTLSDCTISGNNAGDAGGVLVLGGSLAVNRSTLANNLATNTGGGILARGGLVTLTVVDSTISGNFAVEDAGGVYQYGGSLSMSGSTIWGNAADNDHDGTGRGGGICNLTGSVSLTNCTVSGNSAGEGGAGIFSDTGQTISIAHSTITGNVVPNVNGVNGGGINSPGNATLNHTIVAGNLRGATTHNDVSGTFDASFSLIGDKRNASVNNSGGSQIGTTASPIDAKLGALANNGGLTLTHALLSGSPALDAGNTGAVAGVGGIPQFDQRGTPFSRVVDFDGVGGARIDIGAVEMTPSGPALPGDYNLNHVVDGADYVMWRKTQGNSVSPPYSGADGDGNSVIDTNDYTVWRAAFGNASGEGTVGTQDATGLAFAALAGISNVCAATDMAVPTNGSAAIERISSLDLLMALDGNVGGANRVNDDGSTGTYEPTSGQSQDDYGGNAIDEVKAALDSVVDGTW